jgi:site-specific recombinase XerD
MASALIDAFMFELSTQRRASRHTLAAYRSDLDKLIGFAGKQAIAELTAHDIRQYVAKLHAGGLSAASDVIRDRTCPDPTDTRLMCGAMHAAASKVRT